MTIFVSPRLTFHAPPRDEVKPAGSSDARRRKLARAGEILKLMAALKRDDPAALLLSIMVAEARRYARMPGCGPPG